MRKVNVMKLTICFAAFVFLLNISLAEARSLKVGEVYKSLNGGRVIEVISKNEMEIAGTPGVPDTILAEYSFKGDKLRIVIPMLGTRVVNYYEITKEGLKDKDGGILYSKASFARATKKALIQAVKEGRSSEVRTFLSNGANPNIKDKDGKTALGLAVGKNNIDIIRMLIENGANVKGTDGSEAMVWAAISGYTDIVKLLIDKGAHIEKGVGTVCFIKGHGERDINSIEKNGYKDVADALVNLGFNINEIDLTHVPKISKDSSVVILASPKRELTKDELDKLDSYYKGGGALMVAIDPGHPPGFQAWLENYGFKLQSDVIIDQQSQLYGANALTPVVYAYHKKHPLTRDFSLASYFPIANSVYIDEDPKRGRYELALTGPNSWTELDKDQLESGNAQYNEDHEKRGPVPVMAVTTVAIKGKKDKRGAKADRYGKFVLIGDSDFANNTNISLAGNGYLFLDTVIWLSGH